MKRLPAAMNLLLSAALLCASGTLGSCGQTNSSGTGSTAAQYQPAFTALEDADIHVSRRSEKAQTVTVFRCGDFCFADLPGSENKWSFCYSPLPESVTPADGGFGRFTADIEHTYGGDNGISFNLDNCQGFEPLTAAQAAELTGFTEYVPGQNAVYNEIQTCLADGKEYLILNFQSTRYVYLDGKRLGAYGTGFEAECAMGLRNAPDPDVTITEDKNASVIVFRCGDTYLVHRTDIFMDDRWTPLLDGEFKNRPAGFTLKDGEAVYIPKVSVLLLNGGKEGYFNAPMIYQQAETEKCGYADILRDLFSPEVSWADCLPPEEGEFRECGGGEYLILRFGGKLHVYRDTGTEQFLTGVYDTPKEAGAAVGVKCAES